MGKLSEDGREAVGRRETVQRNEVLRGLEAVRGSGGSWKDGGSPDGLRFLHGSRVSDGMTPLKEWRLTQGWRFLVTAASWKKMLQ